MSSDPEAPVIRLGVNGVTELVRCVCVLGCREGYHWGGEVCVCVLGCREACDWCVSVRTGVLGLQ